MGAAARPEPAELLDAVRDIAIRAGEAIMVIYRSDFEVRRKDDESPVTEADEAAERIILPALRALTPDVPVVAEEEVSSGKVVEITGDRFWLVDPLDGTKEFINRRDEFTVNIALIENRRPVLGVVYTPALKLMYAAAGPGSAIAAEDGGPDRPISARRVPVGGAVIVSSRSHGNPEALKKLTGRIKVADQRTAGSSLKFCLVAAGEADLYPRYGRTREWDIAAGHAVLLAAGGSVRTLDGKDMTYGKKHFLNPEFMARGRE